MTRREFFQRRIPRYRKDPLLFFKEVTHFEPDPWQREAAVAVSQHRRVAIRSGQGVGKTALEANLMWWFIACFSYPRIVCTAPTMQQLDNVLWAEMAKWLDASPVLQMMFTWTKTRVYMNGYDRRWFAVPRTATKPESLQGNHEDIGCPVILSNQVQPEAEPPFCIYTVTAPYIPDGGMGDYEIADVAEGVKISRMEMPSATFSFTFCSQNRTAENGSAVNGEDEAWAVADKAISYFKHAGQDDFLALGVAVVDVGQAQDRTTLLVDEAARRVGFDVQIRYTRIDERETASIEKIKI